MCVTLIQLCLDNWDFSYFGNSCWLGKSIFPIVSGGSCLLFSLWVFRVGDLNHIWSPIISFFVTLFLLWVWKFAFAQLSPTATSGELSCQATGLIIMVFRIKYVYMLQLRPDFMHLNCLFYKISWINTSLKLLFYFILTEKYMIGGIKKLEQTECTFIFTWIFEKK